MKVVYYIKRPHETIKAITDINNLIENLDPNRQVAFIEVTRTEYNDIMEYCKRYSTNHFDGYSFKTYKEHSHYNGYTLKIEGESC